MKRYDPTQTLPSGLKAMGDMEECPDGEWVRLSDVEVERQSQPVEASKSTHESITRLAAMLGESLEPGWHIDDARVSIIIDLATEQVPMKHEAERRATEAEKEKKEVAAINGEAILGLSNDLRVAKHERDIAIHNQNALYRYHTNTRKALDAILANPYGCAFCDSGKLRNPEKGHDEACGYAMAENLSPRGRE